MMYLRVDEYGLAALISDLSPKFSYCAPSSDMPCIYVLADHDGLFRVLLTRRQVKKLSSTDIKRRYEGAE